MDLKRMKSLVIPQDYKKKYLKSAKKSPQKQQRKRLRQSKKMPKKASGGSVATRSVAPRSVSRRSVSPRSQRSTRNTNKNNSQRRNNVPKQVSCGNRNSNYNFGDAILNLFS